MLIEFKNRGMGLQLECNFNVVACVNLGSYIGSLCCEARSQHCGETLGVELAWGGGSKQMYIQSTTPKTTDMYLIAMFVGC